MSTLDRGDILPDVPGVLPDNRVVAGMRSHGDPLHGLIDGAAYIRGTVAGLDGAGVDVLRHVAQQPQLQQLVLVVAIYGGSRTWDDVLVDLLRLQDSNPDCIHFRVLARRGGIDRPANLLWVQPGNGGHGHVITGNVGNLLAVRDWEPTDAVVAFPLDPASVGALQKWFDGIHAYSRALTAETAAAPRLHLPEGDAEGERLWREYLKLLERADKGRPVEVEIDPTSGEVTRAPDQIPSRAKIFPSPDPVLLEVQQVLAKGNVIALDKSSRAPPLDAPIKPELFGERGETRSGAAKRQQRFSVSLFDDQTARRLDARKSAMTDRLAACSLMLRDGVRWVPEAADALLAAEFAAVESEAARALDEATGGKSPEQFVDSCITKIAKDCEALAATIAPGRKPPANLVDQVKADLTQRLAGNLTKGMVPGINRSRLQVSIVESDREGPWDLVLSLLLSAARKPREMFVDTRRTLGILAGQEALLAAFNVFADPLVNQYLDGLRVDRKAQAQLEWIKTILDHATASPKQRAHALFRLIKGKDYEHVIAALTEEDAAA